MYSENGMAPSCSMRRRISFSARRPCAAASGPGAGRPAAGPKVPFTAPPAGRATPRPVRRDG